MQDQWKSETEIEKKLYEIKDRLTYISVIATISFLLIIIAFILYASGC